MAEANDFLQVVSLTHTRPINIHVLGHYLLLFKDLHDVLILARVEGMSFLQATRLDIVSRVVDDRDVLVMASHKTVELRTLRSTSPPQGSVYMQPCLTQDRAEQEQQYSCGEHEH